MRQQLAPNGFLDLLTKDELSEAMGHNFDAYIRDLYRGLDYVQYASAAPTGTTTSLTIAEMESGYTWSLKLVACQLSAAGTVSIYPGDNGGVAPLAQPIVATAVAGGVFEACFTWSANQAVIKDQRNLTLLSTAGNFLNYRILALSVPTEMQGKL